MTQFGSSAERCCHVHPSRWRMCDNGGAGDERRQIYQLAATGRSVYEIAASLQRHRSTIYRELNRNRHLDDEPMFRGYFPTAAQTMADRRRVRGGKISRRPELAAYIADRLSAAWSPEQIAGYLRRYRGIRGAVCHETIYHMWTAPSLQDLGRQFDRIACVHMFGLLVHPHMDAGQDGFRGASSKQFGGLRRPLVDSEVTRLGSIDHTICSFPASSRIRSAR